MAIQCLQSWKRSSDEDKNQNLWTLFSMEKIDYKPLVVGLYAIMKTDISDIKVQNYKSYDERPDHGYLFGQEDDTEPAEKAVLASITYLTMAQVESLLKNQVS